MATASPKSPQRPNRSQFSMVSQQVTSLLAPTGLPLTPVLSHNSPLAPHTPAGRGQRNTGGQPLTLTPKVLNTPSLICSGDSEDACSSQHDALLPPSSHPPHPEFRRSGVKVNRGHRVWG